MHTTQYRRNFAISEAMTRLAPIFGPPGKARTHPDLRALSPDQLRDVGLEATAASPFYEVNARVMTALMAMR